MGKINPFVVKEAASFAYIRARAVAVKFDRFHLLSACSVKANIGL